MTTDLQVIYWLAARDAALTALLATTVSDAILLAIYAPLQFIAGTIHDDLRDATK